MDNLLQNMQVNFKPQDFLWMPRTKEWVVPMHGM